MFARGVGGAAGFRSAHTLARLGRRSPAALGFGAGLGALMVSTTAAAGVLAGLVSSRLLALAPAAAAFLGALIGSAAAPLLTGLIDPREGLLLVAVGVLFLGLASDRRASAFGRMVLGAGLIAFGLQTMRPGFDLITQHPSLLAVVSRINADSVSGVVACALLGAALVAILQGPAPVVVLVLVLVQTTARWDLRTALAVLAGSGLGAAIGALVTTPAGRRCRQLAELHLVLGLCATVLSASTVVLWTAVADRLIPGLGRGDRVGAAGADAQHGAAPRRCVRAVAARVRVAAAAVHPGAGAPRRTAGSARPRRDAVADRRRRRRRRRESWTSR